MSYKLTNKGPTSLWRPNFRIRRFVVEPALKLEVWNFEHCLPSNRSTFSENMSLIGWVSPKLHLKMLNYGEKSEFGRFGPTIRCRSWISKNKKKTSGRMVVFYHRTKFQVDTFTIAILREDSLEKKKRTLNIQGHYKGNLRFPKNFFGVSPQL